MTTVHNNTPRVGIIALRAEVPRIQSLLDYLADKARVTVFVDEEIVISPDDFQFDHTARFFSFE